MIEGGLAVIGLGYIGLPTSAIFSQHGMRVHGTDVDPAVVADVNAGRSPIVEPGLGAAVADSVARGLLSATTDVQEAGAYLIAVPTPFAEGRQPDLSYVREAARAIAPVLAAGNLVILESTVPPGTTELLSRWLAEDRPDLALPHDHATPDVFVAHCPERVLPGQIMRELVENDRIIGGITPACSTKAADLYSIICRGRVTLTDARSAEMSKLVENSFRDVNIAFANELAEICDALDLDVWEVIRLANHHPRVNVLKPGPGVGGHCIAVDPWFVVAAAPEHARLIRTARDINDARPASTVGKIAAAAGPGAKVCCLGLAFKADVDDLRESPAVEVVRLLGAERPDLLLEVVEPHVSDLPADLVGQSNLTLVPDVHTAVQRADVVVLLVDHQHFRALDSSDLLGRTVVDTRGFWDQVKNDNRPDLVL